MYPNTGTKTPEVGALTASRVTEGRSRPPARGSSGLAGAKRVGRTTTLVLIAAACSSCVASNYDFDALSDVGGHSRGQRLSEDLALERKAGEKQELYDLDMVPLARTHLKVFAETDDKGAPAGSVELDFDSYLPLFGFIDATVDRYDTDRRLYERHEFNSYLWGLFQTHREQVDTMVGLREERMRRFLWVFEWKSPPRYVDSARKVSSR